jgi:subtilase-type serine protease
MMERVPMNEFVRRGKSRAKVSRKVVELLGGVSLLVLTATPALAQDDTLRIISLNTWGKSSLAPEAVDLFTKGNYDIITIQEYNSSYGNDLGTKLLASEAGAFSLHAMGDKAVASRLPGTGGLGGVRQTPYVKLPANGGLPATIVATEHLNYYDNAFSYRVGQAKELNDWAGDEASPIILTGDFNAGDISERGLLEVVQQELLLTRARETGNTDYKAWALQYVARNHAIGSESYAAAEAYINGTSDTHPTGLFTDETYPVEGNTPYTLNILKKEFQILQNPQDRERFAPHKLADGSTTWPSIGEDDEAFKWPSWGRTQIDHFVVSRPYAKWWELADPANDPYTGGVVDQSVSTTAGGIPLSDHEPVAHEIRWIGPKVEEIGGGSGSVRLTFDAGTGGPGATDEFRLSRNNDRSDVYLGQLSDADGLPIYRKAEEISRDRLAFLFANSAYDRHDAAPFQQQLAPYVPDELKSIYEEHLTQLLDPSGPDYYRTVIQNYFDAHRAEFPGIDSIASMSWEQWGHILLNHVSGDLTFQTIPTDEAWEELWATLNLDDPATRALLGRQTGLDFENDPYAPLKMQLDCSNAQHLALQGARDMCVDDHGRFKDIVITGDKTVAIDEGAALGSSDGVVTLDNGGIRTAGPNDKWAEWTDPVTRIDKAIRLAGRGWIDVSHPTVPVELAQSISGPGSFEKRGAGVLELMAVSSYTGGTTVQAGTLRAGIEGALVRGAYIINGGSLDLGGYGLAMSSLSGLGGTLAVGASALTLDQAGNTTYAGSIAGSGAVTKIGDGTLALTGDSSGFSGVTSIGRGALLVGDAEGRGALGGSVDVLDGGRLGGSGRVGSGTGSEVAIASGGTLAAGNSIGTLTVDGDLAFAAGSRLAVEVNPKTGESDLVEVTGSAALNGGSVAHVGASGNYDLRSTYTILSADGALVGKFDGVTSDFAFLTPDLLYDYDLGTVDLELLRNGRDFASVAQTRNQAATAKAIEGIGFDAGHAVYDAIAQMADDGERIRASFDQLSGEIHASAKSALIEESRIVRDAATNRIRAAFDGVAASAVPVLAYGP